MAITASTDVPGLVLAAHEKLMRYALRPQLFYDALCEVKPTNLTNRGATVNFHITSDLAEASTPLTETADVTPVAFAESAVPVTCQEYGNAVKTTAFLRATSYIEVNPIVSNVIGYNAGVSIDTVARNAFEAGTQVYFQDGTAGPRNTVAAADTLNGNNVRKAVAKLRGANVPTYGNGTYRGLIHPDVAYDFKGATGGTNWSDPHVHSDPTGIFLGVIGTFQGVTFMESPRAPKFAGAGATGADVYGTLIMGREALAKAYSTGDDYGQMPVMVDSPVTDALRRFKGLGWKHFVGYAPFRQAALARIESGTQIGA